MTNETRDFHTIFSGCKYMAHALGGVRGFKYLNCREAIDESICLGHKFIEVDLNLTTDEYVVCTKGWKEHACSLTGMTFKPEYNNKMTRNMFLTADIRGLHPMDLSDLSFYIRNYPDICWMFDLHHPSENTLKITINKILNEFEADMDVFDRIMIQVNSKEQFDIVDSIHHFKYYNYVILKADNEETIDDIIRFCTEKGFYSVSIKRQVITKKRLQRLKDANLKIIGFTVNRPENAERYFEKGVDVLCTDFLSPRFDLNGITQRNFFYNSMGGEIDEELSRKGNRCLAVRKILFPITFSTTKKGAVLCSETRFLSENDHYRLIPCFYRKEGFRFKGWYARHYDEAFKCWRWLDLDKQWLPRTEITSDPNNDFYIFSDSEDIDMTTFPADVPVVFAAVWIEQ